MKGTDDELQFGDMIELDFTKNKGKKVTHHHMECKFLPEFVEMLLENDVIEEREEEECPKEKWTADFEDDEEVIEYLLNTVEELDNRITDLEEIIASLRKNAKK